jgi:hypothetical protein
MTDMTLESALAAICAANDLTSITVGTNLKQREASRYDVGVHWDGFSRRGIGCESGHGPDLRVAMSKALANAAADRAPVLVEPDALPAIELEQAA